MGPIDSRWAPRWPHEPCYQGNINLAKTVASIGYHPTGLDNDIRLSASNESFMPHCGSLEMSIAGYAFFVDRWSRWLLARPIYGSWNVVTSLTISMSHTAERAGGPFQWTYRLSVRKVSVSHLRHPNTMWIAKDACGLFLSRFPHTWHIELVSWNIWYFCHLIHHKPCLIFKYSLLAPIILKKTITEGYNYATGVHIG